MPCFKGIAVSIHANGTPLPEHGVQKQSRVSRINTYIPVPQPQLSDANKPDPAKFAISITLLTPNLAIPYSAPKATPTNLYPKPQLVGPLPSTTGERGKYHGVVTPYIPMTNSENETIAAYIYFDGRAKEEVATLLRPGEETWVNSRWVQVPELEGGGLAEREFLFREVGLERWLNGLDLQGHDAAEKLERRRQKFEKRRRRQKSHSEEGASMDIEGSSKPRGTLRYGADESSPVEAVFDEDSISSSDDDDEPPEATGQIKVAMFRVIASGEIKKGEYSPQFDAHDDSSEDENKGASNGIDADVEHTTSFAKPKTLDPKTISTQTVTGIDGPDKPYAVFTFFYRGERQLQKMGVMAPPKPQTTSPAMKRRSGQLDFSNLSPLKASGTVGFSAFRDRDSQPAAKRKSRRSNGAAGSNAMDADSDDDDDDDDSGELLSKMEDIDSKDDKSKLGPDDAKFSGELADGVNRIRLKRAHSADPDSASSPRKSPSAGVATPPEVPVGVGGLAPLGGAAGIFGKTLAEDSDVIGSPMKKARPSLGADAGLGGELGSSNASFPPALGDILAKAQAAQASQNKEGGSPLAVKMEEEEL
ncbi:hypothetical protein C8A00DRAFT_28663 [Chaetomidium leptoderma]|uniref:DUF7918 domain-containing protein n=1 Tax=Chaetomidium leptoderma TaxID=669021 RepID=A0AAN6VVD9_9PEZI|nr:hypothetical protein C8A00DRAFT_28663 [Chaetomidium leptoderma]